MAIARDAVNSPARFSLANTGGAVETGVSASFTPPAGTVVRVNATINSNVGASPTFSVPVFSGSGLTFTLLKAQTNASGGAAVMWQGVTGASPTAGTVTVSVSSDGTLSSGTDAAAWVDIYTGAASDQTGAANAGSTGASTTFNQSVTTTKAGALVTGVAIDWNATGAPTSSDIIDAYTVAGQTSGGRALKSAVSGAPGSVTLNFVSGGAGPQWAGVLAEILPAATSVPPRANTFHPGASPGYAPQSARFYQSPKAMNVAVSGDVTLALSGQTATFAQGALTEAVDYSLTSQTAAFTEGTLADALSYALTAQTSIFTEGVISEGIDYSLTAQSGTFTEGALTWGIAYSLTGLTANFSEGSISVSTGSNVTLSLSGQTATFTEGALSTNHSRALTAQSASFSEGSFATTFDYSITGRTATFSEGLLAETLSYALTGQVAVFSEGTITPQSSGNVTIQLSGLQALFVLGQVTAALDQPSAVRYRFEAAGDTFEFKASTDPIGSSATDPSDSSFPPR